MGGRSCAPRRPPGTVWLKAAGAATAFEAPLYELLAEVVPDRILDAARRRRRARPGSSSPDGGPSLGARARGRRSCSMRWSGSCPSTPAAAGPRAARATACSPPASRHAPEVMPSRFEEALEAARAYIDERGTESERATLERVGGCATPSAPGRSGWRRCPARRPSTTTTSTRGTCSAGADGGFDQPRFYDWGDSVVAHPFASMLLPLRIRRARRCSTRATDRRPVRRVRDAYLEPFSGPGASRRARRHARARLPARQGRPGADLGAGDPRERARRGLDERWTSAPLRDAGLAARRLLSGLS